MFMLSYHEQDGFPELFSRKGTQLPHIKKYLQRNTQMKNWSVMFGL